jgi:Fe-S-cluster containining protein
MEIVISVKSILQKFQKCEPDYIKNICHGRCCEGSGKILITIHPSEQNRIKKLGCIIKNNFIVDIDNKKVCPFKINDLCSIHTYKPLGCRFSPFTLSKNNVLIVRNRYRLLKCYNTPNAIPVYQAHKQSLIAIIGNDNYNLICNKIETANIKEIDNIKINIDDYIFSVLKENDFFKKTVDLIS